jgi:copper chaperone NosL
MNTTRPSSWILRASALALLLTACGSRQLSGPPELHLGRDECSGCGMIVNEARCSSALLIEEGGERSYLTFDDIGCMLEYERDHHPVVVGRFVHDYTTSQWITADTASFLIAGPGKLTTPMASGIVAFADPAAAQAKQREAGGTLATSVSLPDQISKRQP